MRRLLFLSLLVLGACNSRPDYSKLQIVNAATLESRSNVCDALGVKGYHFYRYTCVGWSQPAEKCFASDEQARTEIQKMADDRNNSCTIISVARNFTN